jgi:hypothetical protein
MIWRWPLALLLLAHGAIHLLGFLGPAGIAQMEGLPGRATFLLSDFAIGTPVLIAFGAVWLVAGIGLAGAGIGIATRQAWWPLLAVAATVVSSLLVILWWDDAAVGLIPNLIVFAFGAVARHRTGSSHLP